MPKRTKLQFNTADLIDEVDIIESVKTGSVAMTIKDWMGDTASLTVNQSQLKEFIRALQEYIKE